jgi:hypothetical protein
MPIAFDPQARRRYVLRCDRKLPAAQRPTFIFRYLTRRAKLALPTVPAEGGIAPEAELERLYERLKATLTGWENLRQPANDEHSEIAFDPEHLDVLEYVLTERELWELYHAAGSDVDEQDVGFFDSPQSSPPGGSASPA